MGCALAQPQSSVFAVATARLVVGTMPSTFERGNPDVQLDGGTKQYSLEALKDGCTYISVQEAGTKICSCCCLFVVSSIQTIDSNSVMQLHTTLQTQACHRADVLDGSLPTSNRAHEHHSSE